MKKNFSFALVAATALFAITASAQATAMPNPQPPMVGGDRDAHGCIGSAGYSWNDAKQQCTRPWEDSASTGTATTNHIINPVGGAPEKAVGVKPLPIRAGIGQERKAFVASTTAQMKDLRAEVKDNRMQAKTELGALRASTTVIIKDMRNEMRAAFASTTPPQRKDMRQQFEEQAKELRASTTAARQGIKDEALKNRLDIAHKQTDIVNARLDAAIVRIQTLEDRTGVALTNLAAKGVNVDASRAKLTEAATKLDSARTQVAAIKLAFESAFASSTPKIALDAVQPLVKEATKTIQAAHDLVAQAISLVKPGLNKERPATTTATTTQ